MNEKSGKREAGRGVASESGARRAESDPRRDTPSARPPLSSLLLLLLLLAACDDSFNPIVGERTDFFAVFGYLDTDADTQFVRVSPLRETLEPGDEPAAAHVASTLLPTAVETVWRDSLVRLDDGETGLLFYAALRVRPGDSYRLTVRGADGAVTEALTQVPPPAATSIAPAQVIFSGNVTQRISLLNLQQEPRSMALRYWVRTPDTGDTVQVRLPLSSTTQLNRNRLDVMVNLSTDRDEIYRRLSVSLADSTIVLDSLGLEVEQLSAEWAAPDVSPNIRNGFGFFGSVAHYTIAWTLDSLSTRRVGFTPP